MKILRRSTGICALLLAASAVWAQAPTAQINGTVKDATGLSVPGADVKATQTATGAVRTVTTGADGSYILTNLPIGPYLLEFTKEGFNKYAQTGIVLQVASNPTIDASLKVGSVSEQVTVQADAALVETHSTGVGQVVDSKRVVDLPLNGRNVTELIFLAGFATTGNGGTSAAGTNPLNSVRNYPTIVVSVAGGVGNGVSFLLDGANHNDAANNLNLPLPFPDALQEFKVETSALPAQYGLHSAAAVNAVTKSGTNEFHGDLFEFLRNGDLNARDSFAPLRDTLKRNQFGGTVGGPVRKDKLFFFAGYQSTSQRSDPSQSIAYVPNAAMLSGDFTTLASTACQTRQITLAAAQGFSGNRIAPSRFDPAALKIGAKLPLSTDPCGKVNFGLLSNQDEKVGVMKVDYQKSDKHSMFTRLTVQNLEAASTYNGSNLLTLNTNAAHDRVYSLAFGDTYLIGANIVSSFRTSASRTELPKIVDSNVGSWSSFGVNANSFAAPLINVSVSGNGFAVSSGNSIVNSANTGPNLNFGDDVSWIRGAHQLGFGASYMHTMMNYLSGVNATGSMAFNGTVSGLGLSDFLIGQASSWKQGNLSQFYNRQNYVGLYAQDAWKLTPRLTVNYGLRWEPYLPITSKYGWFAHFDQKLFDTNARSNVYVNAPAGEIFPGDSQYTAGKAPNKSRMAEFYPRIGLVWDPKGDGRMTVRAAYGLFGDRVNLYSQTAFAQSAPYGDVISLTNVSLSNPWATYAGGNPLPIGLTKNTVFPTYSSYLTDNLDFKPMMLQQWNMSVQRQFGSDWLVTANYLGNKTVHLITADNLNPAIFLGTGACTIQGPTGAVSYPVCSTTNNTNQRRQLYLRNPGQGQFYSNIPVFDDGGSAAYEGMFLSVQRRLSRGMSLLANYTYSHCISDMWNGYPGNGGNSSVTPGNRRADRGNCAVSDQRQIFNLSAVLQTPKFSNRALRLLASDWQVSPIMKLKSSQFFTATTGVDNALNGEGGQRPNLVNPNPYPANQSVDGWILPSAFASPTVGTLGNLGVVNLRGPGVFQLDMAVSRTFTVHEKKTLQIRAEAFNLPNYLNPNIPVSATNSGSFGKIQSDISGTSGLVAGDPRIVQLAMKFVF